MNKKIVTFIDLFAGMGGTRIGFEQACKEKNIIPKCVFTSEIKEHAIEAYKKNFGLENIYGDITKIDPRNIPDFSYLLGGFPCQPFSSAGNRKGFLDERGGLFFTIINILKEKQPVGFLLENVEGLLNHDQGKTLSIMLSSLKKLGYNVNYKLLDSSDFGIAQKRKRVYITGNRNFLPNLDNFIQKKNTIKNHIDKNYNFFPSEFSNILLSHYTYKDLWGKKIKDKRGGKDNIHSWDLELKGSVSTEQKELLNLLLKKRRSKIWAEKKGITWMDGMPLTLEEVATFYPHPNLKGMLEDLVKKKYLTFEYPRDLININGIPKRVPKKTLEKGYNIVAGKLSFPIAHILNPDDFCPTIVATEIGKIGIALPKGVRPITEKEGLAFSGFPKKYSFGDLSYKLAFDLLGNTVMPPVIKQVSLQII